MQKKWKLRVTTVVSILLLTTFVFFLQIYVIDSYIVAPRELCQYFNPRPNTRTPWKYRILFRLSVNFIYQKILKSGLVLESSLVGGDSYSTIYGVFITLSFLFIFLSAYKLYQLMRLGDFSHGYSMLATILFFSAHPILFAYTFPVYTMEDTLGYLCLIYGLYALVKEEYYYFIIFSILGAMTRETLLILIPTFWLFSSKNYTKKILYSLPAVLCTIIIRVTKGFEVYNVFDWSRANYRLPFQSSRFFFLAFGILWIFAVQGWKILSLRTPENNLKKILKKTSPLCLLLIISTTIILARMRENRIFFLGFPWIIGLSITYLASDDFKIGVLKHRLFKLYLKIFSLLGVIVAGVFVYFKTHINNPSLYHIFLFFNKKNFSYDTFCCFLNYYFIMQLIMSVFYIVLLWTTRKDEKLKQKSAGNQRPC